MCRCLDKSIETPSPHVSIGGGGGAGGREHGPLWKTPVLPLNPAALNAPVPQPSWHLPRDVLNELKETQWDTWCSSHGTPLLLYLSALLCPPAQAQRRKHHGTKNMQSATVYQAGLSSSPTTTPPWTHSPTSLLRMSDFSLLGCIPRDMCVIVGMEEIAKERKGICVLLEVISVLLIRYCAWLNGNDHTWAKACFHSCHFNTYFLQLNFVYLLDIPPTYFLISGKDLHFWARCLIMIISRNDLSIILW